VFDPQFSWDPIAGAARYEVEVNPSADFAVGSKVCCTDPTTGTSLSPVKLLGNNRYFWRVRAIDNDGNAGQWNNGPTFTKTFDVVDGQPSIHNLRVEDNLGALVTSATQNPVVRWDPVPGAAGYEIQGFVWNGSSCDYLHAAWDNSVSAPAWTPVGGPGGHIGPAAWPNPNSGNASPNTGGPARGQVYCIQVRAYTDDDVTGKGIVSPATDLAPAFTYAAADPADPSAPDMPADKYRTPQTGSVSTRVPLFTWEARPGAAGYYVVVARDPQFTQVTDVATTTVPAYAPRSTSDPRKWTDETTSYYWAVIPVNSSGGGSVPLPPAGAPQPFDKRSVPPANISPGPSADVPTQPVFRWTPAEGALNYQLQVARDADFGDLLENVTTTSTAYTTSSTYPADTVLYWRVRANDDAKTGLTWSSTSTFRRRLPAPDIAPGNPGGGTTIPVLSWNPVSGAVSYDMHVDQADGTTKDFSMSSTSFTPTLFYGHRHLALEGACELPERSIGVRLRRLHRLAGLRSPHRRAERRQGHQDVDAAAVHVESGPRGEAVQDRHLYQQRIRRDHQERDDREHELGAGPLRPRLRDRWEAVLADRHGGSGRQCRGVRDRHVHTAPGHPTDDRRLLAKGQDRQSHRHAQGLERQGPA